MIRISPATDMTALAISHAWLRDYNAAHVTSDHHPVHLVAHDDDDDALVGALDGGIEWRKLHVKRLAVHPDRRHTGIGTQLMHAAEELATARGCTGIYLDTRSYQALDFYVRLGHARVADLEGFAGGATKHFLHKELSPCVAD